ncbi:MAG: phosphotransferase [Psychromonas sp.]|nr:phosphotransferase [Psychromonas sp.]
MPSLPVTYSVTCTEALLEKIIPQFNIVNVTGCVFWCQGLNESYKVTTANKNYLLRIYRYQWRTLEEIQFELDALLHLNENGADIAYPIATINGDYIINVEAPEGLRYAILTSYIEGNVADLSIPENVILYAEHMADIHQKSAGFKSNKQRFQLNCKHLITEPLQRIKPFLRDRPDDWQFLTEYANSLTIQLQSGFDNSLDIGFCHGDLHGGNAHLSNNKIVSFDFDCCGIGLRVYDLAIFKWATKHGKKEESVWDSFLNAYQKFNRLTESDLALIGALVSIRQIWLIGLHIDIAVAKGWLNDKYFDHNIGFLRNEQK